MKSPMTERLPPDPSGRYTDMKVCKSAAGYYVGTVFENFDDAGNLLFEEPGSRDSDYFRTREEAQRFLDIVESCNLTGALRQNP